MIEYKPKQKYIDCTKENKQDEADKKHTQILFMLRDIYDKLDMINEEIALLKVATGVLHNAQNSTKQ